MVSIKDVAAQAGVAISTVSKVLNHYPNVSDATKEKVNNAIRELNYVPNSIAAALSSKRSGRIAIMMDPARQTKVADEIYMRYLLGSMDCARELDLQAMTFFFSMIANMDADDMTRYFQSLGIGGLVIFGLSREDRRIRLFLEKEELPAALVDVPENGDLISSVGIDQEAAQYDVARQTIEEFENDHPGQTIGSVLYVSGKGSGYVTADRTKGIRRLTEERGISLTVRYGDYSEKKAYGITLAAGRDKDAIICASDLMAAGASRALKELGQDKPVCGFDGLTLLGYLDRPIYTVRQDFYAIARAAVEEIRYLMDGESGKRVIVPHSLVRLSYEDVLL
ncbi:MAG: LacI family transcriptional regulator [Lachnospiraceae bacterium]|nr:LacI family transcriptional regulator [Lachnospiraceae bacterium]